MVSYRESLGDEKASKYATRGNRVNGQNLHSVRKMRQRRKHKEGRTKEGGHTNQTLYITQITTDDSLAMLAEDKESPSSHWEPTQKQSGPQAEKFI